jgi:hypothetical protein
MGQHARAGLIGRARTAGALSGLTAQLELLHESSSGRSQDHEPGDYVELDHDRA